jgi:hypothetical protein
MGRPAQGRGVSGKVGDPAKSCHLTHSRVELSDDSLNVAGEGVDRPH